MERRMPPIPHWWCLTFNNPDQWMTDKGKSGLRASLEDQGIRVHWNAAAKIWIVVTSAEAAITCWILGNSELIDQFNIKVRSYTPNDKESNEWVKKYHRVVDPYLI